MRRLEDLPLLYRILLAIGTVVAVLLIMLIIARFVGQDAQAQTKSPDTVEIGPEHLCMDEESRERIRRIMAEALDEGLKNQISRLYDTWVRDFRIYKDGLTPARKGARNAIIAYQSSRASLIEFNPPLCEEKVK
jgi:hypothetical protein